MREVNNEISRFPIWAAMAIGTFVVIWQLTFAGNKFFEIIKDEVNSSIIDEVVEKPVIKAKNITRPLVCASVSLLISSSMVFIHLFPNIKVKLVTVPIELLFALTSFALYVYTTRYVTHPEHNMAQGCIFNGDFCFNVAIRLPNLYIACWGTFLLHVHNIGSIMTYFKLKNAKNLDEASPKELSSWYMVTILGAFIVYSVIGFHGAMCEQDCSPIGNIADICEYIHIVCTRKNAGIYCGAAGILAGLFGLSLGSRGLTNPIYDAILSTGTSVIYGVAIVILNQFNGPGNNVNDVFIASWSGFIVSFKVLVFSLQRIITARYVTTEEDELEHIDVLHVVEDPLEHETNNNFTISQNSSTSSHEDDHISTERISEYLKFSQVKGTVQNDSVQLDESAS
mmetsp:Transcript_22660/g.31974  ORF Transcript_22660/g.31974 Transcript_22660/m.31974 type:complete len:396 (-) Transcript_22660:417-1604(-)